MDDREHLNIRYVAIALVALLVIALAFPALEGMSILGFTGDKTYLVILQDNQEIRSTGGLMACTALLTMHDGNVKSLRVAYAESNATSGLVKINGPESFTEFFGVQYARLYDSNVEYDFASFAPTMLSNYEQATGQKVDGVIAVDFTALEAILSVTGPITVSGQVITSMNVADQVHYYSGISTGDKPLLTNFLSSLALEILNIVHDSGLPEKMALLNVVQQLGSEKHVFAYVPGNVLLQSFTGASTLPSTDFISVIDANLGSGKADLGVSRSVDYRVELLADGSTVSMLTLTYTNDCGWDYQVFNTVLVPPGAELTATNSTARVFDGPLQTNGTDFSAFSARLVVPAYSTGTVTYSYRLPNVVHASGVVLRYDLSVQKQGGIDQYTLSTTVQLPQGATLVRTDNVGTNQTFTADAHVQVLYTQTGGGLL